MPAKNITLTASLADVRRLVGDEMFDYLLDQCIEMLLHSNNVEEVFAEDLAGMNSNHFRFRQRVALLVRSRPLTQPIS